MAKAMTQESIKACAEIHPQSTFKHVPNLNYVLKFGLE